MTISVSVSEISQSPSEDSSFLAKRTSEPKKSTSKFQKLNTLNKFFLENEPAHAAELVLLKKPENVRRVIFRRDFSKNSRKLARNSQKRRISRRKSEEDHEAFLKEKGKIGETAKVSGLEDFERVKKFSKKEREQFQSQIFYLKTAKKIAEFKAIAKILAYIVSASKQLWKIEFLSKSKFFISNLSTIY